MSVIPAVSWINSGTADYITRQEVIDFASSVVQYVSAGGLSSINFNVGPNPSFSTINVNPTGSINMNGADLTTASKLGLSTNNGFILAQNAALGGVVPTSINGNVANQVGGIQINSCFVRSIYQTPASGTGAIQKGWVFNRDGLYGASNDDWTGAGSVGVAGLNWLGSNGGNQWSLTNVSTINGIPPNTSGTTFTTLTGNTLNSQTTTALALGSVSSINGLVKIPPFTGIYNLSAAGVPNAPFFSIITIPVATTIPPNSIVSVSVPVSINSFAPGSPAIAYFNLGVRVGGPGGTPAFLVAVALPTALPNGCAYLLCGQVLTPSSPTNTIEIITGNTGGVAYTCNISNPVSPANRLTVIVPT